MARTVKKRGAVGAYLEHGGIHFFAATFIVGFAVPGLWRNWLYGLLLALTVVHLGIDCCKIGLARSKKIADGALSFLGDQAVHEYFLIGTLLSVILGILGGLILLKAFCGTVRLGK